MDIQLFEFVVQLLGSIQMYSVLGMVTKHGNCHVFFSSGRHT